VAAEVGEGAERNLLPRALCPAGQGGDHTSSADPSHGRWQPGVTV